MKKEISKRDLKQRKFPPISALSKYLFWDTPQNRVTWEENGPFLVGRILQYGQIEDWRILRRAYGIIELGEIATNIKYLDPKTLSFISFFLGIPKEQFRCYKLRSLNKGHWIY